VSARAGLACLTAVSFCAGGSPGVRPRANAADYPAHYAAAGFAIGATVIPPTEVKKMLTVDLNAAGYLAVEVGVFPLNNKEVDLSPGDFSLLSDADRVAVRPVDSDAVAAHASRKYTPPKISPNSDVYTSASVGVARVPTYDPNTGKQGHATEIGTAAGVGVGAPPPMPGNCRFNDCDGAPYPAGAPASSAPRSGDVEQDLWQKSLPDGRTTANVAGYLYFPKPSGKAKSGPWQLVMDSKADGQAGRVKLTIR
jgi:hypothetical protein